MAAFFEIKNEKLYIVFLAFLAATPALATDMYLSAIPLIAKEWGVGKDLINLSLVLWFVSFSCCLMIFGPLSDKYGRRPILIVGMGLFVLTTFSCSMANNPIQLILCRILQGVAAAAPSSMCMAICRDKFEGKTRQKVFAYIGVILSLAPMIAPSIGAQILKFSSWRFIFIAQASVAVVPFLLTLGYRETIVKRYMGHFVKALFRFTTLLSNKKYLLTTISMGLIIAPFYGYIAFSPVAYISLFGLSEQTFGLLFGLSAFAGMVGAFTCSKLIHYFSDIQLLTFCLIGCSLGALGIVIAGDIHYALFALFVCVITFSGGMSRPLSNNLVLEQVDTEFGTASSFLIFYQFIVGAPCMAIVTMEWEQPFRVFGLLSLILPFTVLLFWPFLIRLINTNRPHVESEPPPDFVT